LTTAAFLTGLNPLQARMIDVVQSMAVNERVFVEAKDLLHVIALEDWGMDEDGFEEECEELASVVGPIEQYSPESVGYAYRVMLGMGLPWRSRYPCFNLSGMIGDFHDEIPFGPESVEVRLSRHLQTLIPINKNPLLPLSLLNGLSLPNGDEIPSHNLEELWMAMEHVRQEPNLDLSDLMEILPGPDFGPGGVVGGTKAIHDLYALGDATLILRGKIQVEIEGGRTRVAIVSLPHGVLIKTILDQIRALTAKSVLPLYDLKESSEGMNIRIVLDVSPVLSADQLKGILYRETDLERSVHFRCAFIDESGWSVEGPLLSVLKKAVAECSLAWERKDGQQTDFIPFIRDIMRHGGYKNPLSKLTDERRTAILKIGKL